jgi:hypothetical protein
VWLDPAGARERIWVDRTEVASSTEVTATGFTMWRNRGLWAVAEGSGPAKRAKLLPAPFDNRHNYYSFVSAKCQTCHSTHYTSGTYTTLDTKLVEAAANADQMELLALALRRGAKARPTQGDERREGGYVLTIASADNPETLRVFVSEKTFRLLSWEYGSGESTTRWRITGRHVETPEDPPAAMFKDPSGSDPRSPTEILIRTVAALRATGKAGTALRRQSVWASVSGETTTFEVKVTSWLSADRTRERANQVAVDTPAGGAKKSTISTLYRSGNRYAEVRSAKDKRSVAHPRSATSGMRHSLLHMTISPKCQHCHCTHPTGGDHQLAGSSFKDRVADQRPEEVLAGIIETSDVDVRAHAEDDDMYVLGIRRLDTDSGLTILVRASDFAVTEVRVGELRSDTVWTMADNTVSVSTLPSGFFDSPVPLVRPSEVSSPE